MVTDGRDGQSTGASAKPAAKNLNGTRGHQIIDIRYDREEISLRNEIHKGLRPEHGGEKTLPTLLLYDEPGLKLFEDITYLEEYYPTEEEIEVLTAHADTIARCIKPGSIVLELGSGNLRKVDILLRAIDRQGKDVEYYALDLSLKELERTLAQIPGEGYRHVKCFGLHGTYDDGLEWLKLPRVNAKPKFVLSLGSSIGNFTRNEAADFLRGFATVLGPEHNLLIGIDGCKDPKRVFHAYNDREGVTHAFIANGLDNANRILGENAFDPSVWRVFGNYNSRAGRHEAFVSPRGNTYVEGILIREGEKIRIEESHKYDAKEIQALWQKAKVQELAEWTNQRGDYGLHMVSQNPYSFLGDAEDYAAQPVPALSEWIHLWNVWDVVTRKMIPDEQMHEKPIKLRNVCIFYLGHIPTFVDMKLAEVTNGVHTEPSWFTKIFERGIDPDVENPEQCHAHSEIPDTWPPLEEILQFQERVRQRIKNLYDSGIAKIDPQVQRGLWLGYEHECMHLETLLYMLIQSDLTLPPPNTAKPDFGALAKKAQAQAVPNEWFTVPESVIGVGLDDPESASGPSRFFGWDIEKPSRKAHVHSFQAKGRPITIGEYAYYLQQTGSTNIPASWNEISSAKGYLNGNHTNGAINGNTNGKLNGNGNEYLTNPEHTVDEGYLRDKTVRSLYGPVPLSLALHWPVAASYDELSGCAAWMGGRIPTADEARSIYNFVDCKKKDLDNDTQRTIPAVNSHLVNDGVEETPPSDRSRNGTATGNGGPGASPDPRERFVDLKVCNVGFQQWHPSAVTHDGNKLCGQGEMGGLWEWTSSPLRKHQGYEPMPLYEAYSQDFFDEKHNIVLGGSWATPPRLAGRKAFVNWYQRNYPYAWAGARLVRDL